MNRTQSNGYYSERKVKYLYYRFLCVLCGSFFVSYKPKKEGQNMIMNLHRPNAGFYLSMAILCLGFLSLVRADDRDAGGFSLSNGTLWLNRRPVLQDVPGAFELAADPSGAGVFLKFSASHPNSYFQSRVGLIDGLRRFTSCHRDEPFWMVPATGRLHAEVQVETQWLLAETELDDCVMLVPLLDGPFRFSLGGGADGLMLIGETGDPFTVGTGGTALFLSVGRDPYAMANAGARAVMAKMGTGKLRTEKPTPDFTDFFGWCTWDSFYREVSAGKVREGLASFAAGGVEPRFLILDDGWQDYKRMPTGEERLVSLGANQSRFGGDLAPTVRAAKEEYKIRTFLVWHTMIGYWSGVDGKSLPGYGVRDAVRLYGPGILKHQPYHNVQWWGPLAGLVPADRIGKFFNEYHKRMSAQGVDGVKVDNQSVIEGLATGQGGRVALAKAYRGALENSVAKHFNGRLINCMANAMETYYGSPGSTLMRTSIDFWPRRPETHGLHLYTNAQVGVWFGEFMQPDWDMFQSAHAMGSFHAAGRAVSGGPVYVSDRPDAHDFSLLKKLVLSDGTVLRADGVGRPTRDCLFADPTREPVLLKIFNRNKDCAVVGVFNANYHASENERAVISGSVSPSDVPGLKGESFAAFAHRGNRVWTCGPNDREPVRLNESEWEIVSFAPVDRGVAILGLADKLNSTAAVSSKTWGADGSLSVSLRDGGEFAAWTEKKPRAVVSNGKNVVFSHEGDTGRLSAALSDAGPQTVVLSW
jgi:raffinose synthase